ncbi:cob(I)yrinic acid a,c-diamide adenosyltransferase [Candidatus Bipolaricaulota bacterium]|nr:cob(I)yrinic acid a,c-diamide adenosyltransferase [Candidatus Bipolaricaulota bacterium]
MGKENGPIERELRLVQVFWGGGRGKTSAATGTAVRALGHGLNVHLIHFFKGGSGTDAEADEYGELVALRRFDNFSHEQFGISSWIAGKPTPEQRKAGQEALEVSTKTIASGEYDLVILDEILYAISLDVIEVSDLLKLLTLRSPQTEVILTGSHLRIPEIEEVADQVTEIKKVKHPYDRGISARKGIDY